MERCVKALVSSVGSVPTRSVRLAPSITRLCLRVDAILHLAPPQDRKADATIIIIIIIMLHNNYKHGAPDLTVLASFAIIIIIILTAKSLSRLTTSGVR